MKKFFYLLVLVAACTIQMQAQVPDKFNYQAVARNSLGQSLANANISLRLTILDGGANGTNVYSETRQATTNQLGLFTAAIGGPGATSTTGNFATIDWSTGNKFIKVEADPLGGTNFSTLGNTEMLSVPYALYAVNGKIGPVGPQGLIGLTGAIGPQGPIGLTGPIGPQGPIGLTGPIGPQGSQGIPGTANVNGTTNFVGKFIAPNAMGNSSIFDNGTNIGLGTTTPNTSAQLDITSTTKGILIPRMTDAEKNAIPSPAQGLLIFNTNTNSFQYYNGVSWANISHSGIISGTANKVAKFNSPWGLTAAGVITDNGAGVAINTTNTLPNSSAILDISSSNKGVLIPRMTTGERTAIATPATGLLAFDNTTNSFWFYNGSQWTELVTGGGSSKWNLSGNDIYNNNSGNVGIGTTTPTARLHVTDSSVLFSANGFAVATPGNPPVEGAGRRMMWFANKAAFRAGQVNGTQWDNGNIGLFSVAFGFNTIADDEGSTAMGMFSLASGNRSTSIGSSAVSTGAFSTAIGDAVEANGQSSMALGSNSIASGFASTAIGAVTTANGNLSTAMGYNTIASGDNSTTMGNWVSTNNQEGSFVIGDNSTTTVMNAANANNFRARFAGGYRLFTSANLSTGCTLFAGDNAWTTGSDVHTKENFAEVNGEDFLKKISSFHLTSWNYKTQNPKTFRHYGPMAQDFHAAFGKDKYGTIGNDTTINSADFAGVSFIAIQALEKRTQKIEQLEKENAGIKKDNAEMKTLLLQLRKEMDALKQPGNKNL